ncbi:glutamate-cysteine ligase [Vibrio maritimus]|uniref:Glutamate-cysteine ligase n=1 Tax=Vibrio maritimus TaxID=990268 RepID=A0A090SXX3_9VIBR|nr:glutamate-cysteine ligase [Vibrio maritimus]
MGCELGKEYRQKNLSHEYKTYSTQVMEDEVTRSVAAQLSIESADSVNFDDFLSDYFAYLSPEQAQVAN